MKNYHWLTSEISNILCYTPLYLVWLAFIPPYHALHCLVLSSPANRLYLPDYITLISNMLYIALFPHTLPHNLCIAFYYQSSLLTDYTPLPSYALHCLFPLYSPASTLKYTPPYMFWIFSYSPDNRLQRAASYMLQ